MSLNLDLQTILRKLAPGTPAAKRNRFVEYLDEACPRYEINTELRLAAFLATVCFESDYFKATAEYGKGRGKKYGVTINGNVYYGRGLIQTTWLSNYEEFERDYPHPIDFVNDPEFLEQPQWAVESACFYWKKHNLNALADRGRFAAIQGVVNRGSASKTAKDLADRTKLYNIALHAIPDLTPYDGAQVPPAENPATFLQSPLDDSTPTGTAGPAPSFFDSVTGKVKYVQDKLVEMRVDPEKISPASWFTTISTQGIGYVTALWAFISANPTVFIAAAVLVGVGVYYFNSAKGRVHANKLAGFRSQSA